MTAPISETFSSQKNNSCTPCVPMFMLWQPKFSPAAKNKHSVTKWPLRKKVNLEDFSCNHTSTDLVIKVFHFFFKMETDSVLFMVIQILGKEFMFMAHQVIEDRHFKLPKMSCYLQFRQVFSSLIQQ